MIDRGMSLAAACWSIAATGCYASHAPADEVATKGCGLPAPGDASPGWALTKLDTESFETQRLAVDEQGFAHAVWTNPYVSTATYYATNRTGSWVTEVVVDEGGPSFEPADVATSGDGAAYLLLSRQDASGDLLLATREGESWNLERVASSDYYCADLDLHGDGSVGVAFQSSSAEGSSIHHATDRGGTWRTEEVDVGPTISGCAVAHAPDGSAHLAYLVWSDGVSSVRHARRTVDDWVVETLDGPAHLGLSWPLALSLDAAGVVHIGYVAEGGLVVLLSRDGVDVTTRFLELPAGTFDPRLAVEPDGTLHATWIAAGDDGGTELLHWSARESDRATAVTAVGEALYAPFLAVELPCCEGRPAAARAHFLFDDGAPGGGLYHAGPAEARCTP